jgi:hypothetical protein
MSVGTTGIEGRQLLPSNFQPQQECYLKLANGSYIHGKVTAVKFTNSKVLYDLDVDVDLGTSSSKTTRVHAINGDFLFTVDYFENEVLGNKVLGQNQNELENLRKWKKEFSDEYFPIIEFMQENDKDLRIGDSIRAKVITILKNHFASKID